MTGFTPALRRSRASTVLVLLILTTSSHAQAPLESTIQGELTGNETRTYTVNARAGDLIAGTVQLTRKANDDVLKITLANAKDPRIKEAFVYGGATVPIPIGFVVPDDTPTRLVVSARSSRGLSFILRTQVRTPDEQPQGIPGIGPPMQPTSPRIARLRDALAVSQAEEVERFWGEISSGGSPLIERIDGDNREYLATFVWRATYKIQNVLVLWPGRAESDHYMTHIPGTDIWYRTVQLVAGSRFSYQLAPNDAGRLPHFSAQHDPFNQHSILARSASVLELPGAPDGSSYLRTPRLRGAVAKHQIESRVLKGRREVSIYTPPAYASGAGPYALLLLFDGLAYEQQPPHLVSEEDDHMRIGAPVILDNLIGDQRIRPTVACLVNYGPDGTRADLGNPSYPDFIATELLPWIRARYAVSVNARDVVIGGYSAGGGAAGAIALKYPDLFGNVLLQSAGGPRLTPLILANARQPIRFYQEGGIYEFVAGGSGPLFPGELALRESTVPSVFVQRRLHDVLRAKGYDVTYVETGTAHEDLHWRATLPDALVGLLGTQPN